MPASSARRAAPRVFISYSHDSEEHRAAVLDLAQQLRGAGLDVQLDRYVTAPAEGWPRWMVAQVEKAKYVLVVCTPTYRRRFEGKERPGKGLGATFEGLLALQLLYERGAKNRKFVPVLFPRAVAERSIPLALKPYTHFRVPGQWSELVGHLHGRAGVKPAPLGDARATGESALRSEGLREVAVGREDLLEQVLLSLFTDTEFRRWIARDPECAAIANKLPGSGASREELVSGAIAAMVRQGLIDQGLFERLQDKFPRRYEDLQRAAQAWGCELPPQARKVATKAARKTGRRPARKSTPRESVVEIHVKNSRLENLAGRDIIHNHKGAAQAKSKTRPR